MAIKDSAETWVRGKPGQAMVLIAAIGVVIGGVLGLGAGFKIEQYRTRSDVKRLQNQLKLATAKTGVVTGAGPARPARRQGDHGRRRDHHRRHEVAGVGAGEDHERDRSSSKCVKGKTADIVVGSRVLVTITAHDVIVLPKTSKLGRLVSTVGTDSFSITKANGKGLAKIKLSGVSDVEKITPATSADIKTGSDVLAGGRGTSPAPFTAVQVILLPANSPFAN